ncbi:unnamed protein product [Moneuplotes crassus]|uniref:F-box domain-containing protein n=1 Tax=Euplotes crassus TaxID=5936 RepID=A0AAD1UFL9_EUPCR|nr:unnamed protein product [Moneuplotes crassus]
MVLERPKFYNILLENGGRLKYRKRIIQVLFSFLSLKEIALVSKVSRRLYKITGLKEVLVHFTEVENPEGNFMIKTDQANIQNTVVIEKTTNENDRNASFDIIVDQYARPLVPCGSNIFPQTKQNPKSLQDESSSYEGESSEEEKSMTSTPTSGIMQAYIREGCNIVTPYWSMKSSSNRDLSTDQILLGDTGSIDSSRNLKYLLKNMAEINHNTTKWKKSGSMGSSKKKLNFKSNEFDLDFCESIKEEEKEDVSISSPNKSHFCKNITLKENSDRDMETFLLEKNNWDRVNKFNNPNVGNNKNAKETDLIGPLVKTNCILPIARIETITSERLICSSSSKKSEYHETFGGSQEYQNPSHINTLNN